ncbi:excalibur calcium-binding domain-containing protein [Streptococcus intermedius]
MKKALSSFVFLTLIMLLGIEKAKADNEGLEMYRLYNPNSGEHFYTANWNEKEMLSRVGWRYEGISWYAVGLGAPISHRSSSNSGNIVNPEIYPNCEAARRAGVTPIYRGQPGYSSKLDRDGDGVACE